MPWKETVMFSSLTRMLSRELTTSPSSRSKRIVASEDSTVRLLLTSSDDRLDSWISSSTRPSSLCR